MQRKINQLIQLSIIFWVAATNCSCSFIMKTRMGVKKPKVMDEKLHTRYLKKLGAPMNQAYIIDTNYLYFLEFADTLHFRKQKKNHYQPIQALYYGHSQFQEAWFINCFAPGFPHLNWNNENKFGSFPPTTAAPLDSLVSFDRLIAHAQPFKNSIRHTVGKNEPYTVVFFWNRFMKKESKRLHKILLENLKNCPEPYRIIYINNDNIFAHGEID